ncbi:BtrH N-terminal domain-containing protein [Paenibacillus piscarius]|uniref:BtrH N-terminal domain-containing protein n=1 Tax=Paenibacillus piscarius TaxID=1089681 RepID=UPI001EE7EC0E
MSKRSGVILDVQMKRESKSFTDALYAVTTAAGLFEGPKFMLSGLSSMAFKFTVHEKLLPMSVTAYGQWGTEHRRAVDNLGIFLLDDGGRTRHDSFGEYQRIAVEGVKQSLDRGLACIYWIPEFGVIHGYDEDDQVFYVQDGWSGETQIVLYDNFGLNFTPFWDCVFVGERVEIPLQDAVLESLRLALEDWETPHKTLPDVSLGSGRLAYTFLTRALQQGGFDSFGAVYILESYQTSRIEISAYLREVQSVLPGLKEVSRLYDKLAEELAGPLAAAIREENGSKALNQEQIAPLCAALEKALELEEQAMGRVKIISGQYPDLKRSTLPRWGVHTAR